MHPVPAPSTHSERATTPPTQPYRGVVRTLLIALGALALLLPGASQAYAASGRIAPDGGRATKVAPSSNDTEGDQPTDKLGQHDRALLAKAERAGKKTVTVLVATQQRAAGSVAANLDQMGATVDYSNNDLGYVRAKVPVAQVEKAASIGEVTGVDLNENIPVPEIRPDAAGTRYYPARKASAAARAAALRPQQTPGELAPAPGPATPVANPYLPIDEVGAPRLSAQNPVFDGRAVTIGILDTGVDVDHPALQYTTDGQRKITDWVSATDPLTDNDPTWLAMRTPVSGPKANALGRTWRLPMGDFYLASLAENVSAASPLKGDLNRDGDTTDSFGVLYRKDDQSVWVDTNRNNSFLDETPLLAYGINHSIGHFGFDRVATPENEAVPFTVQVKPDVSLAPIGEEGEADFVNIGIVSQPHGTHVAGIAVGNNLFGGQMTGAAPGARLVSAKACTFSGECTASAMIEGMIDLVMLRHVDVVNVSIGGLPALNDGVNARAQIYNRLIDDYGVQIFASAGNDGPGSNTAGDPAVASNVISVGASVSAQTWLFDYGARVSQPREVFNFSSRGPSESGAAKPEITAPGAAISTTPLWMPGVPVPQAGYQLPPGYAMYNGTSMASPMAAGVAAQLLSASWANEIPVTAAQLRKAIISSASFQPGISVSAQGAGQILAPRAWSYLARDEALQPWTYTVQAPVCTVLSRFLPTPQQGQGLYNRCPASDSVNTGAPDQPIAGQAVGQTRTYPVTITRTSGPDQPVEHRLSVRGNTAAYAVAPSVVLPLNEPVQVPVTLTTPRPGDYSALLLIDDPDNLGVEQIVNLSVLVAQPLLAPSYQWSESASVERTRARIYQISVPEGAKALQVQISGLAAGSQTRFLAFHPYGLPVDPTESTDCYAHFSNPRACNPIRRTYANPTPGVWQIVVESRRTTPTLRNPYVLSVDVQGVQASPDPVRVASAHLGQSVPVQWSLTNQFAPVTVTASGGPLGSAHQETPRISNGEMLNFEVTVPEGAALLEASIANPSDAGADLDLVLLRSGREVATSAGGDSNETIRLENPQPGAYTVMVVAYDVPEGSTTIDYRDLFTASALGWLEVSPTPIALADATPAELKGQVVAGTAPAPGRQLYGQAVLHGSDQTIVGYAAAVVEQVLPAGD